jgi:hypothetical protein
LLSFFTKIDTGGFAVPDLAVFKPREFLLRKIQAAKDVCLDWHLICFGFLNVTMQNFIGMP